MRRRPYLAELPVLFGREGPGEPFDLLWDFCVFCGRHGWTMPVTDEGMADPVLLCSLCLRDDGGTFNVVLTCAPPPAPTDDGADPPSCRR